MYIMHEYIVIIYHSSPCTSTLFCVYMYHCVVHNIVVNATKDVVVSWLFQVNREAVTRALPAKPTIWPIRPTSRHTPPTSS